MVMAKRAPQPVDVLVGQNIRICRLQKGLSQTELGERIGVTFQQIQKYEKGANRVGARRLTQIAGGLGLLQSSDKITSESMRSAVLQMIESIAGGRSRRAPAKASHRR